jgi:hypothetical protein
MVWPQNHWDGFSSVWASKSMVMGCEWFGLKTTWPVFADLTSKPVVTVFGGLTSKPAVMVLAGLASKPVVMVFVGLASKSVATVSSGLASKPTVMVFARLASKPVATIFSSLASKLLATVSPGLASKPAVGSLVEPQNQGGGGFSDLGLKTGSSALVIWASKSPRWFLSLGPKTKRDLVCWLHHKTDRGKLARDTRRDLAACFTWKQVWLGFPSLA